MPAPLSHAQIMDLFCPENNDLPVRETPDKDVYIQGCSERV